MISIEKKTNKYINKKSNQMKHLSKLFHSIFMHITAFITLKFVLILTYGKTDLLVISLVKYSLNQSRLTGYSSLRKKIELSDIMPVIG